MHYKTKGILALCLLIMIAALVVMLGFMFFADIGRAEAETPIAADAEPIVQIDDVTPSGSLPESFSWKYLATTGGAALLVYFIVQYAKAPLDTVWKIPTRLLVYILCLITLLIANSFLNHGLNTELTCLSFFNALISAFSAYGLYEVWIRKKESAKT